MAGAGAETTPALGSKAEEGGSGKVIFRAFLANLGIAAAKFAAALMTGSSAMLTEGIHSLVDTSNQGLLWLGEKRSSKPADTLHPLGYGRELYFWSVIVAMLIFGLGSGVSFYEGYAAIAHPEATRKPLIAFGVLLVAFLLEGWSLRTAWHEFDARRGAKESVAEGIHNTKDTTSLIVLLEDSAAVLGVVIAAVGIGIELLTGDAMWDGVASIAIGVLLAFVAVTLLRESKGLLIGESADPELVEAIRHRVAASEGVDWVDEVLTIHLAPERVVAVISADFANDMAVGKLEQLVERLEADLRSRYAVLERVYLRPVESHP